MNRDFLNAVSETVHISQQKWVEWQHEMKGIIHCGPCMALHECWFVYGNEPMAPLHDKCHCKTVAISTMQVKNNAKATSKYSKFDPYLFNTRGIHLHGKDKLFKSWGYNVDDAPWLQEEIEKQCRINYLAGKYELGKLDLFGQRLNIRVEIPRKDGHGMVSFITGWTVCPYGEIKLNTPYGGN